MRVATYTRISTDEDHQPFSLEAQEVRLSSYVQSQDGWTIVHRFSDQMSGSKLERPGLQDALASARSQRYDLLLTYRVDRLARSVKGLAQILEELAHSGVHFRSATEPFDTGTAAGRMMVQMLGVFAEFERATLIDRVVAGMERRAARGRWLGGTVPLGYRQEVATGNLVIDADQVEIVKQVFNLYVIDKLGVNAIAERLRAEGCASRGRHSWSHRAVLYILRNEVYVGRIAFRGNSYASDHPAVIDATTFRAAQSLLKERGEDVARRSSNPSQYLLSGLITCGRCGKRYLGTAATGRSGSQYAYYTCYSRQRYSSRACSAPRLTSKVVDQAVVEALKRTLRDLPAIKAAAQRMETTAAKARPKLTRELAATRKEMTTTHATLEGYFRAFEKGTMSAPQCGSRVDALTQQLEQLKAREVVLIDDISLSEGAVIPTEAELAEMIAEIDREAASPQRQKALLRKLVARVDVDPNDSIRPTFRVPRGGVRILERMVGRDGLEPSTSPLLRSQRCASRSRGWIGNGGGYRVRLPRSRTRG